MPGGGMPGGTGTGTAGTSPASTSGASSDASGDEGGVEGNSNSNGQGDSQDVTLEDGDAPPLEPSFEESQPTFEESSTSSASSGGAASPRLDQATIEELERILGEELETFDGTIMREQRNTEQTAGGATASGAPVVFQDYGGAQTSGSSSSGSGVSSGVSNDVGVGVAAANIPPADPDDDIVARQLREAAIAEADPQMQQKLWDEYYRYTGRSP